MNEFDHLNFKYALQLIDKDLLTKQTFIQNMMNVVSSMANLCCSSFNEISTALHMCIENNQESDKNKDTQSSRQNDNCMISSKSDLNHTAENNSDISSTSNEDYIRFTNNGPIFSISEQVIGDNFCSYISEQSNSEQRSNDGSIFLDFPGSDWCVYPLMDYLNKKNINFSQYEYKSQLDLLELFEFLSLPLPPELVFCRERRDTKFLPYLPNDDVHLYVNNEEDLIIKQYLINEKLWCHYIGQYNKNMVNYDSFNDLLYIRKEYHYFPYIHQYITNQTLSIPKDELLKINQQILSEEFSDIFGEKGINIVQCAFITNPTVFSQSSILNQLSYEHTLLNWVGKDKKWVLLFNEHDFSAAEFHKYCDNKGETIVLIKHIGHDNYINIFGGYTDQNWSSSYSSLPLSKEFLFTLTNEYDIPPTKYLHTGIGCAIGCCCSWGPVFGRGRDLFISDHCHKESSSYCIAESYATISTHQKSSLFVNTSSKQQKNSFVVDEYEVWGRSETI
ncbi:hypothetical protein WA158_005638 [Blastocystis sp. Blastoise]